MAYSSQESSQEDGSYSDDYSQSYEEKIKVESEESSLDDEDFDFLT